MSYNYDFVFMNFINKIKTFVFNYNIITITIDIVEYILLGVWGEKPLTSQC